MSTLFIQHHDTEESVEETETEEAVEEEETEENFETEVTNEADQNEDPVEESFDEETAGEDTGDKVTREEIRVGEIHDDAEINSVVEESDIEVSDVEIEKAQEELDELEKSMEVPEKFDSVEDYNELLLNVYSNEGLSNEDKVEIGKQCVESLNQSDLTAEEKAKANAEVASDVRALNNPDNSDLDGSYR